MRTTGAIKGLGGRIRKLRAELGMSQEELAAPYYSAAYISHLENDRRSPSGETLEHIADKLGVTVDRLLTGRDPNEDLRVQMQIDQAIAQLHSGDAEGAETILATARATARRSGFTRALAAAVEGLGLVAKRRADWPSARELFSEAESLLADQPPEARTSALTQRAWTHFMTNEISEAIHLLEGHLVELGSGGEADPTAQLQVFAYLIAPYFEAGLKEKAADVAERAHRLEPKVQDPENLACLNINRAQILIEQGHREDAMKALARAEDLYRQLGWRDSATKAAIARAIAATEAGDLDAGRRGAQEALQQLEDSPSALDEARVMNLLGRIARLSGEPKEGLQHLARVPELLGEQGSPELAWSLREAALCHMQMGGFAVAEAMLRDALDVYRGAGAVDQIATTAAYLGDALAKQGRGEEALTVYREGLARVEDLAI